MGIHGSAAVVGSSCGRMGGVGVYEIKDPVGHEADEMEDAVGHAADDR
jgi:hypothetical protein